MPLIDWNSLCTLTPEVQCLTFHPNHVVWQTKIKSFEGMEMIPNKRIGTIYLFLFHQNKFEISIIFSVLYIYIYIHTFHIFIDAKTVLKPNLNIKC